MVRKRRTLFTNTVFFPSYGEFPNTIDEWAISLYVYVYVISHPVEEYKNLEFGAMFSPYFAEDRGTEYLEIARQMKDTGKITSLDEKRIKYVLGRKNCSGAIVSWN